MKKTKRISNRTLTSIVMGVVFVCVLLALIITNVFFPVKYFLAYARWGSPVESGEMRVTFIDVGYGDCTLVELPDGKVALIDSGDGSYENVNKILTAMNDYAVENIDYLICTSVKDEHCGGFAEIMKYKTVSKAFIPYCRNKRINDSYYSFTKAIKEKNIEYSYCCRGEGFFDDEYGYFLTFLSPTSYLNEGGAYDLMNADPTPTNKDNASAVIWLEYDGTAFVFSSDARKGAFAEIIENYKISSSLNQNFCNFNGYSVELPKCKFVTVAGHGGEENACTEWYEILNPEAAIVSVGKNFAGCPSPDVMTTVSNFAETHYTKYNGSVTITCKDGETVLSEEKE